MPFTCSPSRDRWSRSWVQDGPSFSGFPRPCCICDRASIKGSRGLGDRIVSRVGRPVGRPGRAGRQQQAARPTPTAPPSAQHGCVIRTASRTAAARTSQEPGRLRAAAPSPPTGSSRSANRDATRTSTSPTPAGLFGGGLAAGYRRHDPMVEVLAAPPGGARWGWRLADAEPDSRLREDLVRVNTAAINSFDPHDNNPRDLGWVDGVAIGVSVDI